LEKSQTAVFIVGTPIGNLSDMSPRAISTLRNVNIIAAEDTRNTRKLLAHFGITGKDLVSYHDHGEESRAASLLDRLQTDNLTLALVSDAGTPCVADPGYRLVRMAKSRNIPVHPIPGPSAVTSLVSASGLPSDRFTFVGFLPQKEKNLASEIESWSQCKGSIVFFDPTRKLASSLAAIQLVYPNAEVSIGRELTKLFEEIVTLPIAEAYDWVKGHSVLKGEVVVMITLGVNEADQHLEDAANARDMIIKGAKLGFQSGKTLKDMLKEYSGLGMNRSDLYQLLLSIKGSD
jgi:16S rRNA (cytidine1402-2'-O)-methyltransferase